MKEGDIVVGPSIPDSKVRTWRLVCVGTDGVLAIGQNMAARNQYLHPLKVSELRLKEATNEETR